MKKMIDIYIICFYIEYFQTKKDFKQIDHDTNNRSINLR